MQVTFHALEMIVNSSPENTHVVRTEGGWFYVTAPEYSKRRLRAEDTVAASEELRTLINETDIAYDCSFWYIVDDGVREYLFSIKQIDQNRIVIQSTVGDIRNDPNDLPTAQFIGSILQSGLCDSAQWSQFGLDGIEVSLRGEVTQSALHRSVTYEAILRCFPGRAE